MRILHITNDYSGSSVYKNLVQELDSLGLEQIIYTPLRDASKIGKNELQFCTNGSKILYSSILNKSLDRLFYKNKVRKISKDIESKIAVKEIDLIHAHTWYSDGGVAFRIHKKYGIPYIISVRNTDLNVFQKYLFYERAFGCKILKNAKAVILVAASYKNRLLAQPSLKPIAKNLLEKLSVIPNGVDKYWINNAVNKKKRADKRRFDILYIGKFAKGKNVLALQSAINEINKGDLIIHLHLIGGGGDKHNRVISEVNKNPHSMTFHGKIFDLEKLKGHFERADIFTMPSRHETFGLVYVEALLQGIPVLYTHNEGIDGFYEEKFGEKVSSGDVDDIKERLIALLQSYNSYEIPTAKLIANHDWRNIALTYYKLYRTT